MRKWFILALVVFAVMGAVVFSPFQTAEVKNNLFMKEAEVKEINVMTGYALGELLYSKHRVVLVNSSEILYLSSNTLAKSDGPLNIIFEAGGDITQNELFEFKRVLIINATKNITGLILMAGKFLMSGADGLTKAPDWVSCEIRTTGNNIERTAKSRGGILIWDDGKGIEGVELPPGIYMIEARIYGIPKEKLNGVKFVAVLTIKYDLTKNALYLTKYNYNSKGNIEKLREDFESLDNWSVRLENGFSKVIENFKGRSNVLLLLDSSVKYVNEIRLKPPFRLETEIYVPKTKELYGAISIGGINGEVDKLDIEVEAEEDGMNISLYINAIYLDEMKLEGCEYGEFCWDKVSKQISEGWHEVAIEVDSKGNVTLFVDGKFAGELKLKLKGLKGYMSIFSTQSELGIDYIEISEET